MSSSAFDQEQKIEIHPSSRIEAPYPNPSSNPEKKLNFTTCLKKAGNQEEFDKFFIKMHPRGDKSLYNEINQLKIFPVFISNNLFKFKNDNVHFIGDALFAFPPSFAQGASQSIEGAYELFKSIENKTENSFFKNRVSKIRMVNKRSKFNQFAFHLSNPLAKFLRDFILKRLVKNKKFLESYLGKIYR